MEINNIFSPVPFYANKRYWHSNKWYVYGQKCPILMIATETLPFQIIVSSSITSVKSFKIKKASSDSVERTINISNSYNLISGDGYNVLCVNKCAISALPYGHYYYEITLSDNTVCISDIIAVISDMSRVIKITYRNIENLYFSSGYIDFSNDFAFELYVQATIGKPEYEYEEEMTKRLGYKFIESQIVNKVYKFSFPANEQLCDAYRLVRMCDYIRIDTYNNDTTEYDHYNVIYLSNDVSWQDNGDIATIETSFETDSIVQKLQDYSRSQLANFYNALLSNSDEVIKFDEETIAQYYNTYMQSIDGKMIRQLDSASNVTDNTVIAIDENEGVGPAKKILLKPLFTELISSLDIIVSFTNHINDTNVHITADERAVLSLFAIDENGDVYVKNNKGFYSNSFISAKGKLDGGSGTSGASALYLLNDVKPNSSNDGVYGAAVGKVLMFDGTHWYAGEVSTGLDESVLANYLSTHKYTTESEVLQLAATKEHTHSMSDITGLNDALSSVDTKLAKKVDNDFFARVFSLLDENGEEIAVNDVETTAKSIKAKFGLWTEEFLSAKGLNSSGSGEGGLNETLLWAILGNSGNEQIAINHLTDALSGYATETWVTNNYASNTEVADLKTNVSSLATKLNDFLEGSDTDTIINKWKELEAFLAGYTQTQTLAELLEVKANSSVNISAGTGLTGGGDLTTDRTISLATSGVTEGTYTKVTVDTYGRVTSGNTLLASDIPNLDWSKITTGKPTTLAGYGITDGVNNVTVTGDGNAITTASISGHIITLTKGETFLPKATFDDLFEKVNIGTNDAPVYAIRAKYGFYSDDFVSAKGLNTGSSSGGGALYLLNDVSKNAAGDGVLGAEVGKVLMYDGSHWYAGSVAGGGSIERALTIQTNGSTLATYDGSVATTVNIAIPTKLSELTDDLVANKYLPLTGGTLTGALTVEPYIKAPRIYSSTVFGIGTDANEEYSLTSSVNGMYQPGGTMQSWGCNNATISSSYIVHIGARQAPGYTNNVYFGAVNSGLMNDAAHFVIGRRTGVTSWAESLRIDTKGYVGINTTSPSYTLHVNGKVGIAHDLYLTRFGTGTYNVSTLSVDSNGTTLETPRASDSGSASILPFLVHTRGGQVAPLYAGNIYSNGTLVSVNGHTHNYLPLSGGTLSGGITLPLNYYKGNNKFGINCNNSDIIGANCIYFGDLSDNAGEGIQFYRSSTTWDSLWANSGILYFSPNTTTGAANSTNYTILHSGNYNQYALPLTGGAMQGSIKFNSSSLPEKTLRYICGIDAFDKGGEMGWMGGASFVEQYAPTKTGTGASGTWSINATGYSKALASIYGAISSGDTSGRPTSANITYLDKCVRYFLATSSMTTGKPSWDAHILHLAWDNTSFGAQLALPTHYPDDYSTSIQWRMQKQDTSWDSWRTVVDNTTIGSYNAGSATKLQTARTIFGKSFNGTANVTGGAKFNNICIETNNSLVDSGRSSEINNYNSNIYIQYNSSYNVVLCKGGGKVGIGDENPAYKLEVGGTCRISSTTYIATTSSYGALTVGGDIAATGAITAKASSSDIRLKTDISDYKALDIIRKKRSIMYHWNDVAKANAKVFNDDYWHFGLIAQELQFDYPQLVSDIFKDYLVVDYERLTPILWKGLQEVDSEVTKLKKRVKKLEKIIRAHNIDFEERKEDRDGTQQ